jgi:hypothetical protein
MAETTKRLFFKRGDSMMLGCVALDELDAPVDLSAVQVAAQVRDAAGKLVATLVVDPVDLVLGSYELWAPGEGYTDAWPLGDLYVDVQYTQPAGGAPGARPLRRSSETFYIAITRDETRT